jgi:hypothetical protein
MVIWKYQKMEKNGKLWKNLLILIFINEINLIKKYFSLFLLFRERNSPNLYNLEFEVFMPNE